MRKVLAGAVFATAIALHGAAAWAQSYPDRMVRIIVPSPPGGVTDILARVIAQSLSAAWSQTVLVENRPGADEMIGANAVAKSPADGYSLLVTSNGPITAGPHLHSKMQYDAMKDFTPIMALGEITPVLAVPAKSPVKNVQELIALAKSKPGGLNYGSFGAGTYAHVAMEDFKQRTSTVIQHVPYRGASPAITALWQGETDVQVMNMGNIAEHVNAGTVRVIAAASEKRAAILPDLPTISESGVPGYSTRSWWGLFGPAGLPSTIVDKLQADVGRALRSPEAQKIFATSTIQLVDVKPTELDQFIKQDFENWGRLVKTAGIKPD